MGMGADRDQPLWTVFIPHWYAEDEQAGGTFIVRADDTYSTSGRFSGDGDRTTIGRVALREQPENDTDFVLKLFDENSEFDLVPLALRERRIDYSRPKVGSHYGLVLGGK